MRPTLARAAATFVLLIGLLALVLAPASGAESQKAAGRRLALVIGNSDYENVYALKNAVNDANHVAAALRALQFDVTTINNASLETMRDAVDAIAARAQGADAVLFYFSGHGFQLGGANYLVPTDAALDDRDKATRETMALNDIIVRLQSRVRQTIIILDACRENPLPPAMRASVPPGLAEVTTGVNTFTVFATKPGGVTADGAGDSGPFAKALVDNMLVPDMTISDMMIRVRNSVLAATAELQEPWENNTLRSDFFFVPGGFAPGVSVAGNNSGGGDAGVTLGGSTEWWDLNDLNSLLPHSGAPPSVDVGSIRSVPEGPTTPTGPGEGTVQSGPPDEGGSGAPGQLGPLIAGLENQPETPPALDPAELSTRVQQELQRVGCYSGDVDGNWGKASIKALQRFSTSAKVEIATTDPTEPLLKTLTALPGRVCPLECSIKEVEQNGSCVAKICPAGQKLSSKGNCVTPTIATTHKNPSSCFVFNGETHCD